MWFPVSRFGKRQITPRFHRFKRSALLSALAALFIAVAGACGGSSDIADSSNGASRPSEPPSDILNEEERAMVCETFVTEHESALAVPIHLRAPVFHNAASSLSQSGPHPDGAAGRLAADMERLGVQLEQLAEAIVSAKSSLDFEPVNYMYTRNGLFVDDGDPTTLNTLNVPSDEYQAMWESVDAVFLAVTRFCPEAETGYSEPPPPG